MCPESPATVTGGVFRKFRRKHESQMIDVVQLLSTRYFIVEFAVKLLKKAVPL